MHMAASALGICVLIISITEGWAAEIICGNVQDDARTDYDSSIEASKTTSGKTCTVSIGGASKNSKVAAVSVPLARCVSMLRLRGALDHVSAEDFASQLIPVLVGASVPGFELSSWTTTPNAGAAECANFFSHLRVPGQSSFGSQLHDEIKKLENGIASCLKNGSSGMGVTCARLNDTHQTAIGFSTKFGAHTIVLPEVAN
jgi:hypothetical protein